MTRKRLTSVLAVITPALVLGLGAMACGRGGETDGLNEPGGDTELDPDPMLEHALGGIGVERDQSHAWIVNVGQRFDDDGTLLEREARLVAVATLGTAMTATTVLDVSLGADRRISFPVDGRAVYFEQVGPRSERIVRIDTGALAPTLERTVSGYFTGARTSPSGRFLVANDQLDQSWRVALVHSSTLEVSLVPQEGFVPQGVWNRTSDRLWTVAMGLDPMWARVQRLRVDAIDSFETEIDVFLDGWGCDPKFDASWVAISPDDRWAVFPLWQGQDRRLTLIDQEDGSVRTIPGNGPVGFTPDGSAIVSYSANLDESASLILTDPVSLASESVPLDDLWLPHYYTTPEGSWIVVTAVGGSNEIVLYDWSTGVSTPIASPVAITLDEFVVRPSAGEIWLASGLRLHRLDLAAASIELVPTDFDVRHVNVIPARDALVLTEPAGGHVRLLGMGSRAVEASVVLPDPVGNPLVAVEPR